MYEVESKALGTAINRCLGVIALGDKAESNSITLTFSKKGLTVEANNSVAQYKTEIPVEVKKAVKIRAHILPELLLAYSGAHKKLTLIPTEQHLTVKGGKSFSADMYFVGNNESIEMNTPEDATDISDIAAASGQCLALVGGIRNRTDSQVLGVKLEWHDKSLELTVGDTHHAVIIDHTLKSKSKGDITMTLPNLQKIMAVGKNFASEESRIYAWSDIEYLSIMGQSENVFLANSARSVMQSKKKTKAVVETKAFESVIDTLVTAVDESSPINLKIGSKGIIANVKTGASNAKGSVKVQKFAGKEAVIAVSIHHLKDCLSTMREKTMAISVFSNMVSLESSNKTTKVMAAMSSVGVK